MNKIITCPFIWQIVKCALWKQSKLSFLCIIVVYEANFVITLNLARQSLVSVKYPNEAEKLIT